MRPLETWHLLRFCRKHGIDTHEIDHSINYYENLTHLESVRTDKEIPIPEMEEIIEQTNTYKEIIDILKEQLTVKRAKRNKQQGVFDLLVEKLKLFNIGGFDAEFLYNLAKEKTNQPVSLGVRQRVGRLIKNSEQLEQVVNSRAYYRTEYWIK